MRWLRNSQERPMTSALSVQQAAYAQKRPPYARTTETASSAFDIEFKNHSLRDVADTLAIQAARKKRTRVAFVNAHCINEMRRSVRYDKAVRSADLILPDGSGMAIATLLNSGRACANLNGTDLAPALMEAAQRKGLSIFLLGARPGVAQIACEKLKARFPGLKIAGAHHGYFNADENERVIAHINNAKPDVLLVAFGVPAQDVWLAENAHRLSAPVALGVGGLFDFLSGRIPRAPKLLRKTGLEWTYRLYQEPVRMWRRYIIGNPLFLRHAITSAVAERTRRGSRRLDGIARRTMDIAGAGAGLIVLSPILAATALAVKMESAGPAFFKQVRIGKEGKPFVIYKLRSMKKGADAKRDSLSKDNQHGANAVTFKMTNDPRITRIGRFIRKYSIDELPQLWNVLIGDMSLVGPRPALPEEVAQYSRHERKRLSVNPGITCIWQIAGRANIDFKGQVALDLRYIRHRSVFHDVWILLRTPLAVIAARGAY